MKLSNVPLGNNMTAGIEVAIRSCGRGQGSSVRKIAEIDCTSFIVNKRNYVRCDALDRVYCLYDDEPCSFRHPVNGRAG